MSSQAVRSEELAELVQGRGGHEEVSGNLAEEACLGSFQKTRQLSSAELVPEGGGDKEETGSHAEEARLDLFQRTRQQGSAWGKHHYNHILSFICFYFILPKIFNRGEYHKF